MKFIKNIKKLFKHKGFTLSEVMVTLGVLGVIGAIIIPAITKVSPDANKVMFKKAYSSLERAVSNMINDDTLYDSSPTWTYGATTYNCVDNTGATVSCGFHDVLTTANALYTNNKFCYLLSQQLNTVGTAFCPTNATATSYGYFGTSDGVYWNVYNHVADSTTASNATPSSTATEFPLNSTFYTTKILMDVNGTKGPNCTLDTNGNAYTAFYNGTAAGSFNYSATCRDPDRFIIGVRYDGRLVAGMSGGTPAAPTAVTGVAGDITDQNAITLLSTPSNNIK